MLPPIRGGCACGAVRYEANAEPKFTIICQCRQCQRITGGGHAAQFIVAANALTIEGEIRCYEVTADSGNTSGSGFCGDCGSPVVKKTSGHPDLLMFHAGSLDDPGAFEPQAVVYSQFAQHWDKVDPRIPRQ